MTNNNITQSVDEAALLESVEGIDCPHDFYEIAIADEATLDLAKLFPLKLFPATRTLFRSPSYTIIRLYIGAPTTSLAQSDAIQTAYLNNRQVLDYNRVLDWHPDSSEATAHD